MSRLAKYRLWCNNCEAIRNTNMESSVPTECPVCSSEDINNIVRTEEDQWPVSEIHIPMGSFQQSFSKITDTSITTIRKIIFAGTTRVGTPTKVGFYVAMSDNTGDIKLRDITNNNDIATKLNVSSEDIYVDANTENWPEQEAILAVQGKVDNEGDTLYISDVTILYEED